jgi:hypothetical protein
MQRKLVIVSGGDRVGKSTLIAELQEYFGEENCSVYHHGAPPYHTENIFDFYRDHITEWVSTGKEWCLFDRSWVCSYCLEDFRRHTNGQLDEIANVELDVMACSETFSTIHLGLKRPWSWSAKHHIIELKELEPTAPQWVIRDHYVARQKEHRIYYDKLTEFYNHMTAFPHVWTFGSDNLETIANNLIEA